MGALPNCRYFLTLWGEMTVFRPGTSAPGGADLAEGDTDATEGQERPSQYPFLEKASPPLARR